MAATWVSKFSQASLLGPGKGPASEGVCYYMCHYLSKNDWKKTESFAAAQKAAGKVSRVKMINYAKAVNIKYDQKANPSAVVPGSLTFESLYRLSVGVDSATSNHAIAVVAGENNDETIVFDPNYGFFIVTGGANNRLSVETEVGAMYTVPVTFNRYHLVRKLTSSSPSGWPLVDKKNGKEL